MKTKPMWLSGLLDESTSGADVALDIPAAVGNGEITSLEEHTRAGGKRVPRRPRACLIFGNECCGIRLRVGET